MRIVNFEEVIREAWTAFGADGTIKFISDVSARVSTNHVYKLAFEEGHTIFAKLSYFGKYEHFKEDNAIINILARKLKSPFDNFLATPLLKNDKVFTYRFRRHYLDVWVVFYESVQIDRKLPRRLEDWHIIKLGEQLASFHKACDNISQEIPESSKTLETDVNHLLEIISSEEGQYEHRMNIGAIGEQCDLFLKNTERLRYGDFCKFPVFVDWNIGNFSVTENCELFSRWDYDWFRICSRVVDFYFFSRIVSDVGDKTIFSYTIDPMMEDRFILFLKEYHKTFPLSENEVRFMKEAYRFFILNYVIKDGKYFFHEIYATKLQQEAYENYFPELEQKFNADRILKALGL